MKKIISVLFLCISCCLSAVAQLATIELKVKNVSEGMTTVFLPVNKTVFYDNERQFDLFADGSLKIQVKEDETGLVNIKVLNKSILIFVQKGNTISVEVDTSDKKNTILYKGDNADGQRLLSETRYNWRPEVEGWKYSKDSIADVVWKKIDKKRIEGLKLFEELLNQKKIDQHFFDFAKAHNDYYYACVIPSAILSHYYPTTLPKDNPDYKEKFADDFAAIWDKVFQQYPLDNELALQTTWYYEYAQAYSLWYKSVYQAKKNGSFVSAMNEEEYLKRDIASFRANLNGCFAEYVQANFIHSVLGQKNFQPVLAELFNDFKNQFPKSNYTKYIQPLADELEVFQTTVKVDYTSEQKIVEGYSQVNSFKELLEIFKGKTVYLDMWATWCGPCKEEFEHNVSLKKFLKEKDVAMLYISIDKDEHDQKWKEMVKYYNLQGTHIRVNDSLRKDITQIFWGGEGYSVPKYVLIDKEGNIVVKDALRPSDGENLYKQIEGHIL